MWSNQENRVRKQVKNPCEARKIKASQFFHKIISTHLLTVLTKRDIPTLEQRKRLAITLWIWIGRRKYHEYPEIYTEISGSNQ